MMVLWKTDSRIFLDLADVLVAKTIVEVDA